MTPVCAQMLAVALPKVMPPSAFLIGGKVRIGVNSASWKGNVPTSAVVGSTLPRLCEPMWSGGSATVSVAGPSVPPSTLRSNQPRVFAADEGRPERAHDGRRHLR